MPSNFFKWNVNKAHLLLMGLFSASFWYPCLSPLMGAPFFCFQRWRSCSYLGFCSFLFRSVSNKHTIKLSHHHLRKFCRIWLQMRCLDKTEIPFIISQMDYWNVCRSIYLFVHAFASCTELSCYQNWDLWAHCSCSKRMSLDSSCQVKTHISLWNQLRVYCARGCMLLTN